MPHCNDLRRRCSPSRFSTRCGARASPPQGAHGRSPATGEVGPGERHRRAEPPPHVPSSPPPRAHLGGRDVHHTCRPPLLPQLPLLDLPLPLPGAGARALPLGGQLLLALGGARRGGGRGFGGRLRPPAPGEGRRWLLGGGGPAQGGAGEAEAVNGPADGGRRAVGRGGRAARGQVVVQLGGGGAPRGPGLSPGGCPRGRRRLLGPHLLPLGFPLLQKVRGAAPSAAVAAGRHVPGGLDGESAPPAPLPPPPPALRRLCCRPKRRGPGGAGGRDGGGERDSEKHKHPGEKQKGRGEPSRSATRPRPAAPPTPREAPRPPGTGLHHRRVPAVRTAPPRPRRSAPRPRGLPSPLSAGPPGDVRLPPARRCPDARPPAPATATAKRRPSPPGAGACAIPPTPACLPGDRVPARGGAGQGGGRRSPPARRGRGSGAPQRRRHQVSGTASRRPRKERRGPEASRALPPPPPPFPPLSPSRRGQSRSQGGNCRDGLNNGVRAGRPRPSRCAARRDLDATAAGSRRRRHLPRAAPAREGTQTPALGMGGRARAGA